MELESLYIYAICMASYGIALLFTLSLWHDFVCPLLAWLSERRADALPFVYDDGDGQAAICVLANNAD